MIAWEGSSMVPSRSFISFLRSQKLISKGFLYHLVWVIDSNFEGSSLKSVPIVSEFPDVFLVDLSGIFTK